MRAQRNAVKALHKPQLETSDPQVHAAVSASAGSGKTQVLTARVLRLLIQGARPQSLLCLTFTKAAAAEMANRIGSQLAAWVRMKDSEVATDLLNLGEPNDPNTIRNARRLFAQVLDCPGGLRIQTIHGFAQSLLAAFPEEAGIAPGFRPIEGRAEQELVRRTLADLAAHAEEQANDQLLADIRCLSLRLGEAGAVDYLKACAKSHEALERFGPPGEIESLVRRMMCLPEGSIEAVIADACSDGAFDRLMFQRLIAANRAWGNGVKAKTIVSNLESWLAASPEDRAGRLDDLGDCIITKKDELCVPSSKQLSAEPQYVEIASRFADWLRGLRLLRVKAKLASQMAAGLRAGQAFAAVYSNAKRSAGVADFDDLIEWTRRLLSKPGMGDWVRYKLDRQIDHILVDEAQDTNAAQWEIIDLLVEEFFSGSSETDERWRTLFTVGDFKQAIYGFQGTDPEQFERARRKYRSLAQALLDAQDPLEAAEGRAREFRERSIDVSFRSAQPILDVVDSVISRIGHEEIGLGEPPRPHRAHHEARPGLVELWQPFEIQQMADDSDEGEERWIKLRDRLYAEEMATRIAELIDQAPQLGSTGRPLVPGDILVLVRSRGELASLMVARLFAKGVPVAGVDRLHLHDPLAVQDLIGAVRFAVQPGDDLSLASLLVSPLIGWDQDQLRELAYGREGSLWRRLRERAGEGEPFRSAHESLAELLAVADYTTPSRFLETILSGRIQGRRKLYGRLGMESRDAIDELMNSAIEFELGEIGSLDRFLAWFSLGDVDVQRDPGAPANEVRVMTVHGAKGLQSPVVILADSTADPAKLGRTPLTLDLEIERSRQGTAARPKKDERCPPFAALIDEEERNLQEHWRLLYVALTRAADRLIVAGVAPKEKKDGSDPRPLNCWHRAVQAGLVAVGAVPVESPGGTKLVYGTEASVKGRTARRVESGQVEVPGWAITPAPPEARPPRPLAPSALAEDRVKAPPPSPELRAAAKRGTLIHALLERLPAVEPERRMEAALNWLEHSAGIAMLQTAKRLPDRLRYYRRQRFSALFGPDRWPKRRSRRLSLTAA
jgi:ATP-dependent helicase/nuclease subunit A